MGDAIKFKVVSTSPNDHYVREVGTDRDAAWYLHKALAQKHADVLNDEHAHGRAAQSMCSQKEACDRDRIHKTPSEFTMHDYVVLCEHHAAEFPKPAGAP